MIDPILLTVHDVARLTGLSSGTLYHFISERRIPFVRISARCVRFRRSDLEAWINRMLVEELARTSGGRRRNRLNSDLSPYSNRQM